MFGEETVTVAGLPGGAGVASPIQPGGNSKFRESYNTSISAVALMLRFDVYGARLAIFHNHFASIRIDPEWCRLEYAFNHFLLDDGSYRRREV